MEQNDETKLQTPFSWFVKKAHKPLQLVIEDAVENVCEDPAIGEAKIGDLTGIWVYRFKFNRQEYLAAYRPPQTEELGLDIEVELLIIDFYQVGSHENFYDDLKRYIRSEG